MTEFNTMNAIPSSDVRDLLDNATIEDLFVNGPLDAYADRLGVMRQSLQGIRNASQYVDLGPYAAGLVFTSRNQVFSYLGNFYSPGPAVALPYTTTGAGAGEIANFRNIGDAVLRSDLSNVALPGKGAALVGRASQTVNTLAELRALVKTSPSAYASVLGGTAVGDGGGGTYRFDPTDTTSADNGRTVIVGTDGGRWKQVPAVNGHIVKFSGNMPAVGVSADIALSGFTAADVMFSTLKVSTSDGHTLLGSTGNPVYEYALRITGSNLVIATGPNASAIAGRPYNIALILN